MRRNTCLIFFALVVVGGCASGTPPDRTAGGPAIVQFPSFPAEPVIEWVASYGTLSDVGVGQSKWRMGSP